jgi:hypothetical protein
MTATTINVVTSKEYPAKVGTQISVDGKTLVVGDIFSGSVFVNGQSISTGATRTIDGLRVKVESIGYHSFSPEQSQVILRVGSHISNLILMGRIHRRRRR